MRHHIAFLQGDLDEAEARGQEALALGWVSASWYRLAEELVSLAWCAARRGDGIRAARLAGAAYAAGDTIGFDLRSHDRANHDQLMMTLRELLGDAFEATWETGRALSADEAVAEAQNFSQSDRAAPAATGSAPP
jgi:hypothetical protein